MNSHIAEIVCGVFASAACALWLCTAAAPVLSVAFGGAQ